MGTLMLLVSVARIDLDKLHDVTGNGDRLSQLPNTVDDALKCALPGVLASDVEIFLVDPADGEYCEELLVNNAADFEELCERYG
jgi:hypothetical protein